MVNHEWWKPETFADLGTVPAARIVELSEGRMDLDVPVLLNRAVVEHDVALVLGPVLPHEVVGSPVATSTSSRASAARRSSTSRTGWVH